MPNNFNDEEIVFDFKKIIKAVEYRKILIAKVFACVFIFYLLIILILPKKYVSSAVLYINKSTDTNLTEINPYIIASNGQFENYAKVASGMQDDMKNEITLMTSPLVMDKVIKENNIRYKGGKKKGELLSTEHFLKKNIVVVYQRKSNTILVQYKSKKPKLAYNIVSSIISNYEKLNEEINTKKAVNDKKLLESSYVDTIQKLDKKLLKRKDSKLVPLDRMNNMGVLLALKGHEKSISDTIDSMQNQMIDGQKSTIEIEEEISKLHLVKSKLEWINLVEKMAKNSSNVVVLKQPKLKRKFEYAEPKFLINFLIAIVLGVVSAVIAVIFKEQTDSCLTYSALDENICYNKEDVDLLELMLMSQEEKNYVLINFTNSALISNNIKNVKVIKADFSKEILRDVQEADAVILAGRIGRTPKKVYKQIKGLCGELNKHVYKEILV